jgi:hypothetical protein
MAPLRLTARDYLFCAVPLLLLAAFCTWDFVAGNAAVRRGDLLRHQTAEAFWTRLIADDQLPGWHANGDCFLYAIRLRDKLLAATNTEGKFTFVEWTALRDGPNIHVYTEFDVMDQTWVIDNMTGLHKFPGGTLPAQWVSQVAPRDTPYRIIGGTKALVDYCSAGHD